MMFFSSKWNQFCSKYYFHPQYGYLISPSTQNNTQNPKEIQYILDNLSSFKTSQSLVKSIKQISIRNISSFKGVYEKIILRDCLTLILGKFLALQRQNKKDEEIQVPFPLSKLLIDTSKELGVKVGPTAALSSNWQYIQRNQNEDTQDIKQLQIIENPEFSKDSTSFGFQMQQFQLKYFYTEKQDQEKAFFGTSIAASSHNAFIIKLCYEINQIIQNQKISSYQKNKTIKQKLVEIAQKWSIVYELMTKCSQNLEPQFFYYEIRKYIAGFTNIKFQNYQGTFTSGGGSTGEDPTYQILQRVMGVSLEQTFQKVQKKLRQGMYSFHIEMNQYFKNYSRIKSYCYENPILRQEYQNVLKTYTKVNCYHNVFIRKYILRFVSAEKQDQTYGTGGNKIVNVMSRWRVLSKENNLEMESNSLPQRSTEKIEDQVDNIKEKNRI